MTPAFNPYDWYWVVGGSTTQVYSSKAGDSVPVGSSAYNDWLAAGNKPTQITTEAELGEALAPYSLRPNAAGPLAGYLEKQASELTVQVVAKVLFAVVNDIRALKGQAAITPAQFKNYLRGLI